MTGCRVRLRAEANYCPLVPLDFAEECWTQCGRFQSLETSCTPVTVRVPASHHTLHETGIFKLLLKMNKIFTNHPFVFLDKVLLSFSVTDEDVSFDLLNRFKKYFYARDWPLVCKFTSYFWASFKSPKIFCYLLRCKSQIYGLGSTLTFLTWARQYACIFWQKYKQPNWGDLPSLIVGVPNKYSTFGLPISLGKQIKRKKYLFTNIYL